MKKMELPGRVSGDTTLCEVTPAVLAAIKSHRLACCPSQVYHKVSHKEVELKEIGPRFEMRLFQVQPVTPSARQPETLNPKPCTINAQP